MKKFFLYAVAIVIYSVVVVLLRHSDATIPNWVMWVLSFLLIAALGWISNIGKDNTEEVHTPNTDKKEERYYFYNGRCSFKLDGNIIKNEEEKGNKFTLTTEKLEAVIWILPDMPIHSRYPWIVGTEEMKVGGYPCEVAYTKTNSGVYPSYFIDCADFVVQVNLPNKNTKEELEFLNSFRKEY